MGNVLRNFDIDDGVQPRHLCRDELVAGAPESERCAWQSLRDLETVIRLVQGVSLAVLVIECFLTIMIKLLDRIPTRFGQRYTLYAVIATSVASYIVESTRLSFLVVRGGGPVTGTWIMGSLVESLAILVTVSAFAFAWAKQRAIMGSGRDRQAMFSEYTIVLYEYVEPKALIAVISIGVIAPVSALFFQTQRAITLVDPETLEEYVVIYFDHPLEVIMMVYGGAGLATLICLFVFFIPLDDIGADSGPFVRFLFGRIVSRSIAEQRTRSSISIELPPSYLKKVRWMARRNIYNALVNIGTDWIFVYATFAIRPYSTTPARQIYWEIGVSINNAVRFISVILILRRVHSARRVVGSSSAFTSFGPIQEKFSGLGRCCCFCCCCCCFFDQRVSPGQVSISTAIG